MPRTLTEHVNDAVEHTILTKDEGPAVEVFNPNGDALICLVCEHASAFIPASLDGLGVAPEHRLSHAAWDPGAFEVSRALSQKLNAPFVAARVSRLVYDCNRPPSAPDAMPAKSEVVDVPGNSGLSDAQKAARIAEVYDPFHETVAQTLNGFAQPPSLVTIHSFTPVWHGTKRDVELGLLHDADDRLAKAMLAAAPAGFDTRLNAPYSATDGVTHTLRKHAIPRGVQNVMIEIRNDLITDQTGVTRFADCLSAMLTQALATQVAQ